jgi:hypothetical protein
VVVRAVDCKCDVIPTVYSRHVVVRVVDCKSDVIPTVL